MKGLLLSGFREQKSLRLLWNLDTKDAWLSFFNAFRYEGLKFENYELEMNELENYALENYELTGLTWAKGSESRSYSGSLPPGIVNEL